MKQTKWKPNKEGKMEKVEVSHPNRRYRPYYTHQGDTRTPMSKENARREAKKFREAQKDQPQVNKLAAITRRLLGRG